MALPLSELPVEIVKEVRSRKWLALLLFIIVSFGVLAAGFLWPYKYQSETVIFIDDQNIIRPLMEGSAVATEINDRASAAQELLWSRSVIEKIAKDEEIFGEGAADVERPRLEGRIFGLKENLSVVPRGDSYFAIVYQAGSPMRAFQVAQRMGQLFIEETNERKRSESRNAYEFINNQVRSYERQLAQAEERLQAFLSENVDGTEGDANDRLDNLRSQLELAQLEKSELEAREQSLELELNRVNPTIRQGRTPDAYQTRISSLEEQLDNLRLRYHDTYPDIVILREQLQELRRQRARQLAEQSDEPQPIGDESLSNPVYQEIQTELTSTRADIQTLNSRINSFRQLLSEQAKRMERIQENKAQYMELTRDMEVNKEIYDDLLKRRERARVSMSLDVEGQGLNYRINEKAQYPLSASGPGFPLFAAAGLFLGLAAPFGLVAGLLQIDPRVRAREQLEETIELPVLVQLPEIRTPFEQRRDHRVTVVVGVIAVVAVVVYLSVAGAALMGVIG
ncbi:XrtA system polysaccharide chain length determinant [Marinobacter arenosus]|uniref:XrtA system polysaccharide chain length determinant n=1 Tax=Marinobacter arenosus TaxID=2856822 RepID=UPI001C4D3939|nr:XrtA system polysaccharide chain length determinant [Marinobacter arenosus]MBW0146452.1 lipopolysaccharide biosynthesis protein [Marinobacter arenosus]